MLAAGKVDLDTDRGRQVWRLMKGGVCGFRFGYLVPEGGAQKRACGGRRIVQLDVFEITVCPAPMNPATRVLWTKSAADDEPPTHAELEAELARLGIIAEPAHADQYERIDPSIVGTGENGDHREKAHQPPSEDELRRQAQQLGLEPGLDRVPAESRDLMLAVFDAADKQPSPQARAEDGRADPSRAFEA